MQRFFATLFVLILSPLMLLTLIIVWLWDREAPVFIQERVGLNKELFCVYKIRTMRKGKITGIGRALRKTGIDELPQLFNIMKGEMNFVGPRPLTKADIVRLNWDSPSHTIRWSVPPGISGMAQLVNVCDAQVSWDCDMRYIETRSVSTDLSILWKSFLVPIIGKQKPNIHS
jgi:lipopolysaccharide/colanic/teichoic acid biosynthesis glycosyltransferase